MNRQSRFRLLFPISVGLTLGLTPLACDDDGGDPSDTMTDARDMTSTTDTSPDSTSRPDATGSDTSQPDVSPVCGNDTIDGDEACDGVDLADQTCQDLGFTGGTLLCASDCRDFDTSGCTDSPLCGNGVLDPGEICDGAELDGETCQSQGFAGGGTLGCNSACNGYDTAGCSALDTCGNGMLDAGEDCDGTELGDATCESVGDFSGGSLSCNANCTFDTGECLTCGNGVVETGETCDGDDFGGQTCQSQGFDGGTLVCATDCGTIDTTGCTICGNDTLETGETCDGDALGGATCESLGFDGGTLGCATGCGAYDTSGCLTFSCGNGTLEPGEDCEGTDVASETCETLGFVSGTLACTNCQFDTSACSLCGNGAVDPGEDCDGSNLDGQTCESLGFDGGALSCASDCSFVDTACTSLPRPTAAGQVIITEIMNDPAVLADSAGEWFELYNTTTTDLSLNGCIVTGNTTSDTFTITGAPLIAAGAHFTLAISASPGFTPDYVYSGYSLNGTTDTVRLECNGVEIDSVTYDDGATFPDPTGRSMQLDPGSYSHTANDLGENWCEGQLPYNGTDRGSPGALNPTCALPTFEIGYCKLQAPASINAPAGSQETIYGRVFAAGLTDVDPSLNDPHVQLVAQVGYGPDASDPTGSGWTWVNAVPNPTYDVITNPAPEPNNDEYQATITLPSAAGSPRDYAFRFSGDGGTTWTYCDTNGNTPAAPYDPALAGDMVTTPVSTGTINVFFSEYIEGSSNNKAIELYNASDDPLPLDQCQVKLFANGGSSPTSTYTAAAGTVIAPKGTFVICNAGGTIFGTACNVNHGVTSFNGNDALSIECDGALYDVFGEIGFNPGAAWTDGGVTTVDRTLRRKCSVESGDPIGDDEFDPSIEWEESPIDTVSGLGAHVSPCPPDSDD